jgi:hypothetical protein
MIFGQNLTIETKRATRKGLLVTNLRTSFENCQPSLTNGCQKWWEEPRLKKLSEWRRAGHPYTATPQLHEMS